MTGISSLNISLWHTHEDSQPQVPHLLNMASVNHTEDDPLDVFLRKGQHPTIAEIATLCHFLFKEFVDIMDDQRVLFASWEKDMNVYAPFNLSLDYALRFSPIVVDEIHQILDHIGETIMSCKYSSD